MDFYNLLWRNTYTLCYPLYQSVAQRLQLTIPYHSLFQPLRTTSNTYRFEFLHFRLVVFVRQCASMTLFNQ